MRKNYESTIIGAGITGLTAGIKLLQQGSRATIFDKRDKNDFDQENHLIWLAPNGLLGLETLGLDQICIQQGIKQTSMSFANHDLQDLLVMRGDRIEARTGYPILAIKRHLFHRILLDNFIELGGEIIWRKEVDYVSQANEVVTTGFKCGETINSPYLLACDGVGSQIRRSLFPTAHLRYQGITTLLGQADTIWAEQFLGKTVEVWGHRARIVLTSLDGKTVFFSGMESKTKYTNQNKDRPTGVLTELAQLWPGGHKYIQDIFSKAHCHKMIRQNFSVVEGLNQMHQGRVFLLGDAAHGMPPNMGQGASLGIEDALWLANKLRHGYQTDIGKLYWQTRKSKVKKAVTMANAMNGLFQPKSKLASKARNVAAFLLPSFLLERNVCNFYKMDTPIVVGKMATPIVFRPMLEEESLEVGKLLATEFCRREPLSRKFQLKPDQCVSFFTKLATHSARQGLCVLAIEDGRIVGCLTGEDYTRPFEPDTTEIPAAMGAIHEILANRPPPKIVLSNSYRHCSEVGLVAIASDKAGPKIVRGLIIRQNRIMFELGYRYAFAKITNPKVSTLLQVWQRKLEKPVFNEYSNTLTNMGNSSTVLACESKSALVNLFYWQPEHVVKNMVNHG